ncbi:hypothetical protein E4T56_gene3772, partial [Termitomyces sp. T112]
MTISGLPVFKPHAMVKTIILTISGFREGAVNDKFHALGSINCGQDFPALDEIQVMFCQWPTTEHDIRRGPRSNWVKWSERLMQWNVKLTDENGKALETSSQMNILSLNRGYDTIIGEFLIYSPNR